MRKIRFILIATIAILTIAFTSCESSKQESKVQKATTFVNTKALPDGKIYSIMIFSELTSVQATYMKASKRFDIPVSNIKYNPETTLLQINLPSEIKYKPTELVYTITGVPLFPGEFILCDAVYNKINPGIFINGQLAVAGKDYTIDKKTNHLTFITPVDSDKDSYEILWLTRNGSNAMSNNIEPYAAQYRRLENAWFKMIR